MLRLAYTKTSEYNPYPTEWKKELRRLKDQIFEKQYENATIIAKDLLNSNYVYPDLHYWCSVLFNKMGKQDQSRHHEMFYLSLIFSILESGDG